MLTDRKSGVGPTILALLMLLFVARMLFLGSYLVWEWQSESALLAACGIVWSLAAPATIISALWVLGLRRRSRKPWTIGGWAIIASGAVRATVTATHVLPCGGPS